MALDDRKLFDETVFQLGRPLNRSNIRVLALEPGGPQWLSFAPRFDPVTRHPQVDQVDPAALGGALRKLGAKPCSSPAALTAMRSAFVPATGGAEQKVFLRDISPRPRMPTSISFSFRYPVRASPEAATGCGRRSALPASTRP